MEEAIGFLGVGLGATVGLGLVRSLARGGRSVLRQAVKGGVIVWDSVADAAESVRTSVSEAREEARAEQPTEGGPSRRRREPRKIAIARE